MYMIVEPAIPCLGIYAVEKIAHVPWGHLGNVMAEYRQGLKCPLWRTGSVGMAEPCNGILYSCEKEAGLPYKLGVITRIC